MEQADHRHRRLLRARRERPRQWPCGRRAAEQRDELAALQLTELHLLPLARVNSISDWRVSSQRLVAPRDFGSAYRRFGSFASGRNASDPRGMSASPRKRTNSRRLIMSALSPFPDSCTAAKHSITDKSGYNF